MQSQQTEQTGTRNETYNVIAILYHALQGAENCQIYLQDARDGPAREFIQHALQSQRQLADHGKEILQQVLQNDTGGQSAFGWGSSESSSSFNQGQSSSFGQSQSGSSAQDQSRFAEQDSGSGSSGSSSF